MRIGLPRALLYYWFGPAWKVFFSELGLRPVISPATNKAILNRGVRAAVDEVCLPVKIFLGHSLHLAGECEGILVPELASIKRKEYICPKFMGLPDMTRQVIRDRKLLIWRSNQRSPWDHPRALSEEIKILADGRTVRKGMRAAKAAYNSYRRWLEEGFLPSEAEKLVEGKSLDRHDPRQPAIGIIGHPYCVYDSFINMNLIDVLKEAGYRVLTSEMFPEEEVEKEVADLPKPLFWTLGKRILGAARVMWRKGVKGLIHVAAFACGPEALIGEMVRREGGERGVPLLQLHLDEHSGEAGFVTRVEAFLDLIARKERQCCV